MNYIDVGSHSGTYTKTVDKEATVYSIEPNPYLYQELKKKESGRYKVFNYAISPRKGVKDFHIGHNDLTSSLKKCLSPLYPVKEVVKVKCIRLDTFCRENGIRRIDHLKIDTQGSDFDVLKSLGKRIKFVRTILIECFQDEEEETYEGEGKEGDIVTYLYDKGFVLKGRTVIPTESVDLYFEKS